MSAILFLGLLPSGKKISEEKKTIDKVQSILRLVLAIYLARVMNDRSGGMAPLLAAAAAASFANALYTKEFQKFIYVKKIPLKHPLQSEK
jgi:hypothetical protein